MNTNPLYLFLEVPNNTTFEGVRGNPWMLTRILQKAGNLTSYFTYKEWSKIQQSPSYDLLSDKERDVVENKLKSLSQNSDILKCC